MRSALVKTLKHTLAVAVMLGVAFGLYKLLGPSHPIVGAVLALLLVACEKFVRAEESIPVPDYVNK